MNVNTLSEVSERLKAPEAKTLYSRVTDWFSWRSKEERYVNGVENELRELQVDEIRLLHSKAIVESQMTSNKLRQQALKEYLPLMRHCLKQSQAVISETASGH